MKISPTEVAYVAELANLEVAEDEQEELASELSRIVEYVELLNRLDTDKVEPTAQVLTEPHPGREDRVAARVGSSEAATTVGLFNVPKVISER
jgi:aspartyl-tRNA(Asn)/glutamyl-tRNA(Gln) amidotransferase subunit C